MPRKSIESKPNIENKPNGSEDIKDWKRDEKGVYELKEEVAKAQIEEEGNTGKVEETKDQVFKVMDAEERKAKRNEEWAKSQYELTTQNLYETNNKIAEMKKRMGGALFFLSSTVLRSGDSELGYLLKKKKRLEGELEDSDWKKDLKL